MALLFLISTLVSPYTEEFFHVTACSFRSQLLSKVVQSLVLTRGLLRTIIARSDDHHQ